MDDSFMDIYKIKSVGCTRTQNCTSLNYFNNDKFYFIFICLEGCFRNIFFGAIQYFRDSISSSLIFGFSLKINFQSLKKSLSL